MFEFDLAPVMKGSATTSAEKIATLDVCRTVGFHGQRAVPPTPTSDLPIWSTLM